MSKRKRSPKTPDDSAANPPADDAGDDASAKDDMVHVTPDLLAGSPDIFARKSGGSTASEPVSSEAPEVVSEPIEPLAPEPAETSEPGESGPSAAPEPTEASTTLIPDSDSPVSESHAGPPPPPPYVTAARPHRARGGNSSAAIGVVLIVLGIFALLIVMSGVDLTQYGWPLFVLVPGLTLLVLGFVGMGAVASVPGGIVTMLGLVLSYQNSTGDWPSWAFAWSLVLPFGLGLGIYLQALRDRDMPALRRGRTLMFIGLMIFIFGFVFFESVLGISGRDYGGFGKAALPLLLIVIGGILLVRAIQRSRRAG